MAASSPCRIAVLIPCLNEALTVGKVIRDFREALPDAQVFVFDNCSTDGTIEVAQAAGATVCKVTLRGKGNVIRRMFADVEADVYVLVDGDDTYDAGAAPGMVSALVNEGLDMVVGIRTGEEQSAYRFGHRFGNVALTRCVASVFGSTFTDLLSGFRVFSRRYVKSFPAHASGFETETELTVHALELRMPVSEVVTVYRSRPEGSASKLNTFRDGFRILLTIARLLKSEKPFASFASGSLLCTLASILLALPLLQTFLHTGLVPRLPTALLCVGLVLFGGILLVCGIVLDTVTHGRTETKRLAYLAVPGPKRS
jgi:glycosyltransferase involved in cell wall biosynthesis